MEEATSKHEYTAVARAIVKLTAATVPVCILNVSDEPVTLYAGMVIASMQPIEPPAEVGTVSDAEVDGVDNKKRQILWQLVEECGSELSAGERCVLSSFAHLC